MHATAHNSGYSAALPLSRRAWPAVHLATLPFDKLRKQLQQNVAYLGNVVRNDVGLK